MVILLALYRKGKESILNQIHINISNHAIIDLVASVRYYSKVIQVSASGGLLLYIDLCTVVEIIIRYDQPSKIYFFPISSFKL